MAPYNMDDTIQEAMRTFLQEKLIEAATVDNKILVEFVLGKHFIQIDDDMFKVKQIDGTYRTVEETFTIGMIDDFLGIPEPIEDLVAIDYTLPLTFLVSTKVKYTEVKESLSRFVASLIGKTFKFDDYTAATNVSEYTNTERVVNINGVEYVKYNMNVYLLNSDKAALGNEVTYYLKKLNQNNNLLFNSTTDKFESGVGNNLSIDTIYYELDSYDDIITGSQALLEGSLSGAETLSLQMVSGKLRFGVGINTITTVDDIFPLTDKTQIIVTKSASTFKIFVNGIEEAVTELGTVPSSIVVDKLVIGAITGSSYPKYLYDVRISTSETISATNALYIKENVNSLDFFLNDLNCEVVYNKFATASLIANRGIAGDDYDMSPVSGTSVVLTDPLNRLIPITRNSTKGKTPETKQILGESEAKTLIRDNVWSSTLSFIIDKTSEFGIELIKALHDKTYKQNQLFDFTIEFIERKDLTFNRSVIIDELSDDLQLGSLIVYTVTMKEASHVLIDLVK